MGMGRGREERGGGYLSGRAEIDFLEALLDEIRLCLGASRDNLVGLQVFNDSHK